MRKRWPLVGLVVVSAGLGLLWPDAEVSVETETSTPVAARSQPPDREVLVAPRPSAPVIGAVDGSSSPGRFEGQVVDDDDVPLPGAELTFSKDGDRKLARADAQGHFSFEADDGEWRVERVWAPGHLAKEDDASYFAAAGTVVRGLRFALEPSRVVRGLVLTTTGAPVLGAELSVTSEFGYSLSRVLGRTGADGRFSAEISARAAFSANRLSIQHDCCIPHSEPLLEGAADLSLTIRLEALTSALVTSEGVVVDLDGRPVAGANVSGSGWVPLTDAGFIRLERTALSDLEGRFSILLPSHRPRIHARLQAAESEEADAEPGRPARLVLLSKDSAISGRVSDEEGRPVTNFTVRVNAEGGSGESWTPVVSGDGRFRIQHLSAGPRRVSIEATAFAAPPERSLTLQPGTERKGIDFILGGGRALDGKVVDERTASPLSGARVMSTDRIEFTNSRGEFTLKALPLDRIEVVIKQEGYADRQIQVEPETGPLTIGLKRLERDAGRTQDYEGIGVRLDYGQTMDGGNGYPVLTLHPEGGARVAGILVGDEVMSADGHNPASMDFDQFNSIIKGREGTVVRLTIRRGGKVFDLNVARRRLLW